MYMSCGRPSAAQVAWALGFAGALIGSLLILRHWQLGLLERLGLVALPVIAGVGYVWAVVADMRRMDELQQRIWLEAVSIAFASTMVLLFCEPVLRRAGFSALFTSDTIAMFSLLALVLALMFSTRRYR